LSLAERCTSKYSPRLLSSDPDFDTSQISQGKCSSYPDIDPVDSDAACGPYYSVCDAPKLEYFERGFSSQLTPPTNPNTETEYIDTDDFLVDSAIGLESAFNTMEIKAELEISDLTARGEISEFEVHCIRTNPR